MKQVLPALRSYVIFSLLLGLGYPLAMTALAQLLFPKAAGGSLLSRDGQLVGSRLIAQKFSSPRYFYSRPSSQDLNPQPSGGSNWGPLSQDLKKQVSERAAWLKASAVGAVEPIPQDLLFASGSGLDPDISPEAALYQVPRVAKARGWDRARVQAFVLAQVQGRGLGFLGEPTVNVLQLNLALDAEGSAQQ